MDRAQKRRWITLGVEAVLIVFSVLLALALDEWRQSSADRRRVARIQETITDELERNRARIREGLPYHENIHKSTQRFLEQNVVPGGDGPVLRQEPSREALGLTKGLGISGNLGRTGWDLALNSGALEQMDFDLTVVLSHAYAKQEDLEEVQAIALEQVLLLNRSSFGEQGVLGDLHSFSGVMIDLVLRERELLAAYDRALAMARGSAP